MVRQGPPEDAARQKDRSSERQCSAAMQHRSRSEPQSQYGSDVVFAARFHTRRALLVPNHAMPSTTSVGSCRRDGAIWFWRLGGSSRPGRLLQHASASAHVVGSTPIFLCLPRAMMPVHERPRAPCHSWCWTGQLSCSG